MVVVVAVEEEEEEEEGEEGAGSQQLVILPATGGSWLKSRFVEVSQRWWPWKCRRRRRGDEMWNWLVYILCTQKLSMDDSKHAMNV